MPADVVASFAAAGLSAITAAPPTLASAVEIDYTVPLALFDAVPVILSVLAYLTMAALGRSASARRLVGLGAVAAGIGGGTKVAWKITIAASDVDITWLDDLLFPFLTLGLLLVAMGLRGVERRRAAQVAGAVLAVSGVTLIAATPDAASIVLLSAMTIASIMITVSLVGESRGQHRGLPAVLAVVNLAVVFVLVGFARLDQTLAMQWVEETINACSQGCLLVAAIMLRGGASVPPAAVDRAPSGSIAF